jgi:hypothetical protein
MRSLYFTVPEQKFNAPRDITLTNTQRSVLQAVLKTGGSGIYSDRVRNMSDLPVSSSLTEALKALQKKR